MQLNLCRTSEMPSQYQIGVVLYIGGYPKILSPGLETAKAKIFSKNPERRDSMQIETEDDKAEARDLVMKLVTHNTMQAMDSGRVSSSKGGEPTARDELCTSHGRSISGG